MSYIDDITYRKDIFDQLPVRFTSWLDFYDSLSDELKQEPVLKCYVRLDEREYLHAFRQSLPPLYRQAEINYQIKRDFMLARLAEQLIPARYSKKALDRFMTAVLSDGPYTSSQTVSEFVEPLWAIAADK